MEINIIGATGLVGEAFLKLCLEDKRVSRVNIFIRRESVHTHEKLKSFVVDFNHVERWEHLISGEAIFSSLGTTIKAAGSEEAQRQVDYQYPLAVLEAAKKRGLSKAVLISSRGADAESNFFYMRLKGELELAALSLNFKDFYILRPGPLLGDRKEKRTGEEIMKCFFKVFPFSKNLFHAVAAEQVSRKSLELLFSSENGGIINF